MDDAGFRKGHPGRLVKIGSSPRPMFAYVPEPLPPRLKWSASLIAELSAADRALGRLAGVGRNLPNPHLLIGPFKRREAVLSSRIEGTQASLDDLLLFEAASDVEPRVEDVREVSNYVRALDHGLVRLKSLPMSVRLIREMHGILMDGVRGHNMTPGELRRAQNYIGRQGCAIHEATYIPPPPNELKGALDALERYFHAQCGLPPLVRLALIHYQFEAIHPFLDGNGRIGRLLITLLLCANGDLPGPLLYLSAYFERHRQEYYAGLLAVSQKGQWTEWVSFFLRGVAEQAMDAVDRASRLADLREDFRRRLNKARGSAHPLALADGLFAYPAISVARAAALLGLTHRAAQLNVDKLVAAGIVREVTGRKRNRVYVAGEIAKIIE